MTKFLLLFLFLWPSPVAASDPPMMYADDSRGRPFSKDPHVIRFGNRYLMYYSIPPFNDNRPNDGWAIGIAESRDLTAWRKVGEILPRDEYEAKGLCAPGAIVRGGRVHLFYQTYGNGPKDAICHAVSDDGIEFTRDATNPIFRPTGAWTSGRAIDAEVFLDGPTAFLYFATRDPAGKIQKLGVATASSKSDFSRSAWKQAADDSILFPQREWERDCIEAASVLKRGREFVMFYAGAYNNAPQQIGVAVSRDGIRWRRLSDQPFLANGAPGEWNASESGHPHIFRDVGGRTWLFFQGNNTKGKTWHLSKVEVGWRQGRPFVKKGGEKR
ncbi:MAG: family 43 glycosylhydrolase [Blastocatellia bacterium]|nr:family 43 glycosylhydrolase [Blastocatellia bacterium]